ncbi:MAG: ABC transporter ATP-binding protein [Prevotellaceae bacterium]|jgi:ABC-type multidrug transport system ATPase subunit|nr:ABC transporter ATP-binding protein [Prevotellaceae bacterium]
MKIKVSHLTKAYGTTDALQDISFQVPDGQIFGIIGPDGAGKTTLFRILATLLLPNSGTATIAGFDTIKDYKKIRNIIGYMPGRFSLYQDLSVIENLELFATAYHSNIRENYHLIKDIYQQIEPFNDRMAGKLSGGMKQKLALCCALIHKPEVLFLDEPTTGVDAVSRKEFWEMLRKLKDQGITILVSTPYMDEASLCDCIALIQNGTFLHIDTPGKIIDSFPKRLYAIEGDQRTQNLQQLRNNPYIDSVYLYGDRMHLTFKEDPDPHLPEVVLVTPSVEDCFIWLMKKDSYE